MNIKDIIQTQIYRLQRIAAPMSLILLTLNLSLTAFGFVQWRSFNPYLAIFLIFILLSTTILLAANLNILLLKMHIHERRVTNQHNPNATYALVPRERMIWRNSTIPLLRANGEHEKADKMEKWARLGYIPKEDYDTDIIHHYKDREGEV